LAALQQQLRQSNVRTTLLIMIIVVSRIHCAVLQTQSNDTIEKNSNSIGHKNPYAPATPTFKFDSRRVVKCKKTQDEDGSTSPNYGVCISVTDHSVVTSAQTHFLHPSGHT
jgi:hypothetical protein